VVEIAQRLRVAAERFLDAFAIAVRGGPRQRDQRAYAPHALVARRLAGEHEAQGNKRLVRGAYADRIERAIKWRRRRQIGARREEGLQHGGLRNRLAEKIRVDHFEVHRVRFAATLLAIFFVAAAPVAPSPSATSPSSLDALLATIRKASGEPYRYHVVSRLSERVETHAIETTTEIEGSRYRMRRCSHSLCDGFYSDGARGFRTNLNDSPLPAGVDSQLTLRTIVSYKFTDPDFRRGGGRLIEHPPLKFDDRSERRIEVIPAGGVSLEALIDPATSLVDRVSTLDGRLTFVLRDNRAVAGKITLPFQIDLNDKPYERFDSREIVDAPLEAPAGLVPQIEGGSVTTKMLRTEPFGDVPILQCTIGGESIPCLLDSGNSGLSMSLELAEKLGIEPVAGAFEVSGIGSYDTGVAKAPPLSVGSGIVYPSALYVILHDLHRFGFDLVLGTDAFTATRLTIDYPKREVTFAPATGDALEHSLPLSFLNFVPVVRVGLGVDTARLMLDTGDESSINLAYTYYEAHPAIFKPTSTTAVSGIGGNSEEIIGEIPSVRLADFIIARQRIGATKKFVPTAEGHIGSGFLSHFRVVFDYAHARIGLSPRAGDAAVSASP